MPSCLTVFCYLRNYIKNNNCLDCVRVVSIKWIGIYSIVMNLALAITILVVALSSLLYWCIFLTRKKSTKRDLVLIVGPCGSGKTVLTYQLECGHLVQSVTSMEPHTVQVRCGSNNASFLSIVDFPGHPRLRSRLCTEYLSRAKKVVLVVDSAASLSKFREAAEILYDMLIDSSFENNGPPVLVACNKCDIPGSLSAVRTKLRLQEELEKVRKTRQSLVESSETASRIILGRDGQPFSMDRDAPVAISFESVSGQAGTTLKEIMKFMATD